MSDDKDLFHEEQSMVAMSFGDHIEELRLRLILALVGLMVGVGLTLTPPVYLGWWALDRMQVPARIALTKFYLDRAEEKARAADDKKLEAQSRTSIPAEELIGQLKKLAPKLDLPPPETLKGEAFTFTMSQPESGIIKQVNSVIEHSGLVSLAPLETVTIFFMVCMVTGLVVASPWVFYQVWAFVAAGLYRHERRYVHKFLPLSIVLFLAGVMLCFFGVLPVTLGFLLQFNVWLGVEPTLRLSDWMGFATILPLVFGLSFQTPLVMLFLERIGIFTVEDYRAKRKFAIMIMVVAAAILTPGPDVFSQLMLAIPMIGLYELGIVMIARGRTRQAVGAAD